MINFTDSVTLKNWFINDELYSISDTIITWEIWNQTTRKIEYRFDNLHLLTIGVKFFLLFFFFETLSATVLFKCI